MPALLDTFPYPWGLPVARELHTTLTQIYPSSKGAQFVAQKAGIDPGEIYWDQPAAMIWKEVLEKASVADLLRTLVQIVHDQNPTNARLPFLDSLLKNKPIRGEPEPQGVEGAPRFLKNTDDISEHETLLYRDDLTLPIGRIPWLMAALQQLADAAPAVCRLEIVSAAGTAFGTGFRIASGLLLTNHHVLYVEGKPPKAVTATFGYEDDGHDGGLAGTAIACDPASVVADESADWGVIRVKDSIDPAVPILKLSGAAVPKEGGAAFLIQHPTGARKRIAYVRNQITYTDQDVVQYLSDTQVGSSGSPVLDEDGKLIALHHAGGRPQEVAGRPPLKKNEGIRIARVAAGLKAAGVAFD
jgi:V8-like Glu-specific endopeptidase